MVGLQGMRLMLLAFALIGFTGAGAAYAVARHRLLGDGERDMGLYGIALMFLAFGALCTAVASGLSGVLAFGGVTAWAGYLLMARRLGLLQIEVRPQPASEREATHHHGT